MDLYRGLASRSIPEEFLAKGGTELAPMSTTRYTLHPTPTPYTLHLHPTFYNQTLHSTLHSTPYTLHLTLCTLQSDALFNDISCYLKIGDSSVLA